jgi:nucleotide-binding universal stress UspA family protein
MIKDIMARLEGNANDEPRLAAVEHLSEFYDSRAIGLFFNVLPPLIPAPESGVSAAEAVELLRRARELADETEASLIARVKLLRRPIEIRRFDVAEDVVADIATRQARTADTFVALRPDAGHEPEDLIESVLFGSGRHLFLVPNRRPGNIHLRHVMVAWNASREATRALTEAMPYLHKAEAVTVVVVDDEPVAEEQAVDGEGVIEHLKHHGIEAQFRKVRAKNADTGAALIAECRRQKADLMVMGGFGHSRLREWLLGGATYELLHKAPVPLLIAH